MNSSFVQGDSDKSQAMIIRAIIKGCLREKTCGADRSFLRGWSVQNVIEPVLESPRLKDLRFKKRTKRGNSRNQSSKSPFNNYFNKDRFHNCFSLSPPPLLGKRNIKEMATLRRYQHIWIVRKRGSYFLSYLVNTPQLAIYAYVSSTSACVCMSVCMSVCVCAWSLCVYACCTYLRDLLRAGGKMIILMRWEQLLWGWLT